MFVNGTTEFSSVAIPAIKSPNPIKAKRPIMERKMINRMVDKPCIKVKSKTKTPNESPRIEIEKSI